MKLIIEDAASACLEVNVEDISCVEDCIWLKALIEYLEMQHEYWQRYSHYSTNIECLVEDLNDN